MVLLFILFVGADATVFVAGLPGLRLIATVSAELNSAFTDWSHAISASSSFTISACIIRSVFPGKLYGNGRGPRFSPEDRCRRLFLWPGRV